MFGVARWKIVSVCFINFLIVYFSYLLVMGLFFGNIQTEVGMLIWAFFSAVLFTGSQFLFLVPLAICPKAGGKPRSLRLQIIIAAFIGGALTVGFAMIIASIITSLYLGVDDDWAYPLSIYSLLWIPNLFSVDPKYLLEPLFIGCLSFIVLSWGIWAFVLWQRMKIKHHNPGYLGRIAGRLFAGSIIEFLLAIPLHIMVEKKTDCYCSSGTFGALILSSMAGLWLFGPFVFLVVFWKKRPWTKSHCKHCGYPRKVATAKECSECGKKLG